MMTGAEKVIGSVMTRVVEIAALFYIGHVPVSVAVAVVVAATTTRNPSAKPTTRLDLSLAHFRRLNAAFGLSSLYVVEGK